MKLPSKVRITSKVSYDVLFSSDLGEDILGLCDPENKQITLKIDQTKTEMLKVYLHEVVHAMNFEFEIGITEAQTLKLETAVYKLLKLNKWI